MSPEDAAKEHVLLVMLARAAEGKGAGREKAITLAESVLAARLGTRYSIERTMAMFDEVEAAAGDDSGN